MKAGWKKVSESIRGVLQQINKYNRVLLYALLGAALLFTFCCFFYGDIEATFDNTVLLAKGIGEGEFFRFYEYSLEHANTYWPAGYDILLYLCFAVWNLPVIILHMITGFDYLESPAALMWCKGLTVVFTAAAAYAVYKICRQLALTKKQGVLAAFLLVSSLSLTAPVFIVGQYDTIPLFFMLMGLYYYLKEENRKFYLCFLLSIPLKVYGLFLLLPLILLKEKRIWAILIKTAGTCSLYLVLKLIFRNDAVYQFISGSQGKYGTDKLLNSSVEYSGYTLCLFLGVYAAICIFCYAWREKEERDRVIYPVYICFLVFASFVTLVAINDYWIIFYVPFAVLLFMMNGRYYKLNVLLETAGSGMYLLYAFMNKVYPYSYPELVTERFLQFFMTVPNEEQRLYGSVKAFMEYNGLQPYAQLVHTLFVVAMAALIIVNRPSVIKMAANEKDAWEDEEKAYEENGILWNRVLLIIFSTGLLVYAGIKGGNPVLYSTMNESCKEMDINLLDECVITQDMSFEDSYELERLTLHFGSDGYVKDNFGSVWIRFTDKETGEIFMEKRIGASMVEPGKPYRVSLQGIAVEKEKVYTLSLEGVSGMEGSDYFFSPWRTEDFAGGSPAIIDGEYQNYNLYMEVR